MFLEARRYVLHLAILTRIGQANGGTGPVPVIGRTTGIDQATGKPPLRMNINTLEQEGGPMWSDLTLLGIHGMPYTPYNDVVSVPGGSWGGYCPHQSPQLISWHRAYLVLYEEILGDEVQRLAAEYTNNDDAPAYREASQKLRLPYWDWASDSTLPPSSMRENISVNGPNGEMTLHNPLYNYRWQTYPLNATQFPGQGGMGPVTTRNISRSLDDLTSSIKDSVYRTFSSATTYDQMASMAGSGSSFESPHNVIHNSVGGSFLGLDLTSFDALFMLHHCNLDRLAAMWTASYHDTLQAQPFISQGLYSTARGEMITADSPLKPFYQADGKTFHTGRTMAAIEAFGYTYPETPNEDQGRQEGVIVQINRLYGDLTANQTLTAASTSRREWVVKIQVDRADLQLPCSIDMYLGDHLAGRTWLLSMPKTGLAHDELPLSRAISRLGIDSNEPGAIEKRLVNDLHVQVTKVCSDDTVLDPGDIPSLQATLVGEDVTPPSSESEFPSYSNRTTVKAITANTSLALRRGTYRYGAPDASSGRRQTV
ncbi:Di-copper centre-containing protein [Hypoxylon argillaceum]|nr:Di-copper centre-containing protein [Hypoxylon argillaceum]KAI1155116.1 Di-copper centre-containing protein [Nemania diffusa]